MSSLVAAVLSVKLAHEEEWLRARQRTAAAYSEALAPLAAAAPEPASDREHVFHKYVLRVADRDRVRRALEERGVSTLVHYSSPLSALPFAAAAPHRGGGGRRVTRFAGEVLSLPIHAHLRDDEVERVAARARRRDPPRVACDLHWRRARADQAAAEERRLPRARRDGERLGAVDGRRPERSASSCTTRSTTCRELGHVPVGLFDEQMAQLGDLGYRPSRLDAVLDHYSTGRRCRTAPC